MTEKEKPLSTFFKVSNFASIDKVTLLCLDTFVSADKESQLLWDTLVDDITTMLCKNYCILSSGNILKGPAAGWKLVY